MRDLNEVMARAWCESSWRTRFAKRPRGSQAPTRECTVPLEIAPSVVSMAPHKKSFCFRDLLRVHAISSSLDSVRALNDQFFISNGNYCFLLAQGLPLFCDRHLICVYSGHVNWNKHSSCHFSQRTWPSGMTNHYRCLWKRLRSIRRQGR